MAGGTSESRRELRGLEVPEISSPLPSSQSRPSRLSRTSRRLNTPSRSRGNLFRREYLQWTAAVQEAMVSGMLFLPAPTQNPCCGKENTYRMLPDPHKPEFPAITGYRQEASWRPWRCRTTLRDHPTLGFVDSVLRGIGQVVLPEQPDLRRGHPGRHLLQFLDLRNQSAWLVPSSVR
mgnify:CR=1 FL=1